MVDPGEGYRLLAPGEWPQQGDEFLYGGLGAHDGWVPSENWRTGAGQSDGMVYRRRIEQPSDDAHVKRLESALRLICSGECERLTTGIGSCCRQKHWTPDAKYLDDRWCNSCIAWKALRGDEPDIAIEQPSDEPFRLKPGRFWTRDRREAWVFCQTPEGYYTDHNAVMENHCWLGEIEGQTCTWTRDGRFFTATETVSDIIGPWIDEPTEAEIAEAVRKQLDRGKLMLIRDDQQCFHPQTTREFVDQTPRGARCLTPSKP